MELILAGGGDKGQSKITDEFYYSQFDGNPKMLYIPIALRGSRDFEECYSWISDIFPKAEIEMMTNVNEQYDLENYDTIYIGGGNTYDLLEELRSSEFPKKLRKFVNKDNIVYGGSAGAIILGENIQTSPDEDKTDLNEYSGLKLVKGYSIWPHYTKSDKEKIKRYIEQRKEDIIAIPEESSLYVKDKVGKAIGSKEIVVFKEESTNRIKPGQKTYL